MAAFDDYLQGSPTDSTVDPLTVTAAPKVQLPGLNIQSPSAPSVDFDGPAQPGPVTPPVSQGAQPPTVNYNNSQAASAVSNALTGEGPPRGGMANPGVYGLLPQGLQHGTLRNMLGALGDAFLVGSGHQAQYEPRMQRQEIGQAMAGYDPNDPQSVQAAVQRIASTGADKSPEIADQLQKNYNDVQLRKQLMQQNQGYRQQTIQSRNDNLFNRMTPQAMADLAKATSAADYAARLGRWTQRVQAIDPSMDAVTQFGIPSEYTPGAIDSTSGMTSNQVAQDTSRAAQRAVSTRNTDVNAASRIRAAGIGAGSRNYGTDVSADKPTTANILQGLIDKQNSGQPLTPAEQATFSHMTSSGRKGASLPGGLTVGKPGGTAPQGGGGLQTLTPAQAHAMAAKGGHGQFRGTDGKVYSY